MKRYIKFTICISVTIIVVLAIIFCFTLYSWYHPNLYLKDFESVANDYEKVITILSDYYEGGNFTDDICVDIDEKNYVITYKGHIITLNEDEKQSLKRICDKSYSGHYDFAWVSSKDIIFWKDETKTYGVMYTKKLDESKNKLKKWYNGVKFKRINKKWYEIGHFGK